MRCDCDMQFGLAVIGCGIGNAARPPVFERNSVRAVAFDFCIYQLAMFPGMHDVRACAFVFVLYVLLERIGIYIALPVDATISIITLHKRFSSFA